MVTNFEFYKDEILKITITGDGIALFDGKLLKCQGCDCVDCEFTDKNDYSDCNRGLFEWLYAEHIEQPKLTKRERAFCEAVQKGMIARDGNGCLGWFNGQIKREEEDDGGGEWLLETPAGEYSNITPFGLLFEFIRWEDKKLWTVEALLELEVVEEIPTSSNKVSNKVSNKEEQEWNQKQERLRRCCEKREKNVIPRIATNASLKI